MGLSSLSWLVLAGSVSQHWYRIYPYGSYRIYHWRFVCDKLL